MVVSHLMTHFIKEILHRMHIPVIFIFECPLRPQGNVIDVVFNNLIDVVLNNLPRVTGNSIREGLECIRWNLWLYTNTFFSENNVLAQISS